MSHPYPSISVDRQQPNPYVTGQQVGNQNNLPAYPIVDDSNRAQQNAQQYKPNQNYNQGGYGGGMQNQQNFNRQQNYRHNDNSPQNQNGYQPNYRGYGHNNHLYNYQKNQNPSCCESCESCCACICLTCACCCSPCLLCSLVCCGACLECCGIDTQKLAMYIKNR